MPNRFVDVFAGGVAWDALDDIIVGGVLARPISMLLLLESLSIFLGCAWFSMVRVREDDGATPWSSRLTCLFFLDR